MDIIIKKGLNVPIKGAPEGIVHEFHSSGQAGTPHPPLEFALNLWEFDDLRLRPLKKVGEKVAIGEPLCEDKACPGRMFASPAAGTVKDIRRGLKRRLMDIVIAPDDNETFFAYPPIDPKNASRKELLERLLLGGMFAKIRQRPFSFLATPEKIPRAIFVKAVESAPFAVPAELQVAGREREFQAGLTALAQLTAGTVHLVHHKHSQCPAFTQAQQVAIHTIEGPHPIGTHSLHIQQIDPITSAEEVVWTVSVHQVIAIGMLLIQGRYCHEKIVSIAGPGILSGQTGYFKLREGYPVAMLVSGRISKKPCRLISGNPLTGWSVKMEDFLGFSHETFCVIPENKERQLLHFFRLGFDKYSFSRAYASGHFASGKKMFDFTTHLHGEPRPFIDPTLYDKVMPLHIPTMHLVKAVLADDFELAEELGILEVDPEDFALPTFVCPSKMEMVEIMKQGIRTHAADLK